MCFLLLLSADKSYCENEQSKLKIGGKMNYKDWLFEWLENTVKSTVKHRTYERYRGIVEGQLVPQLGNYELNSITPMILQRFVYSLMRSEEHFTDIAFAANTINVIITVMQNSLKVANAFGLTDSYIADKIKRPKTSEKAISCFTLAEQRKIELAIQQEAKDSQYGILICLYTGLRIGELLALEWEDIDLSFGTLKVNKSCYYSVGASGNYGRIIDLPKTVSSCRTIPLSKNILNLLKELKRRSISKYVVSNGENPVPSRAYQKTFSRMLIRINISHRGFHALRHTFATRAIECGMDVKTLSEILGHKNASITLNRYVHSMMEHKKEMMNRVGDLLQ